MWKRIEQLRQDAGQAMVEYALILGLVSFVGIALSPIGQSILGIFEKVAADF